MLTRNTADARNCYCLASYPSPPPPPPPEIAISYLGHTGLCAPLHMPAETPWWLPVSCFIYRSEEAKPCDKWSTFVKIELKETLVELRERFAINDYGGFKNKGERGRKVRFSARCKAQKAWSSRVSEWRAVQALIKYLQNLWLFLSALNLTGKFWWDSYPRPALLRFSRRSLVESSGYQGLNFPDPRTRRNTICYYTELREDDTGGPH